MDTDTCLRPCRAEVIRRMAGDHQHKYPIPDSTVSPRQQLLHIAAILQIPDLEAVFVPKQQNWSQEQAC